MRFASRSSLIYESFADGMTEELIDKLSKIPGLEAGDFAAPQNPKAASPRSKLERGEANLSPLIGSTIRSA
jgi:TolB-like protein